MYQHLNMALMDCRHRIISCPFLFLAVILVCSLLSQNGLCKERPSKDHVIKWAEEIDDNLMQMNFLFDIVKRQYEDDTDVSVSSDSSDVSMMYEDINELKLVETMADDLSKILSKKMEALKLSVKAAEEAAKAYNWTDELKISDVDYYNSKTMIWPKDKLNGVYSDRFGKEVNFTFSSVHIPVEIYEGSSDILNGLKWTAKLDEQFEKNYKNDKDILWQYFGSQTGFMRSYPATNWNIDGVDLYDVRRQSWYTQGSSSPKDMLILIDKSGSTYGQSLQLMKNAVKSILNTLGENDFVNVVQFSEDAQFVSKCFNHTAFVQANFRNKKQLEKDVDMLEAQGQADFSLAIRFAFEKFEEFSKNETNDENNIGADCNKVIMLLTDGGTDNAEDVFEKYNWPNKTVRVFTYAVGPTPNPIHAVRWMACANKGYFSQIPAMGAIRSRVQEYVRVLERPLAISRVEHALWSSSHRSIYYASDQGRAYTEHLKKSMERQKPTNVYWELTSDPREYIPVLSRPQVIKNEKPFEWGNIYEDHLGLGMMTTVTLPVYNHSRGSSNQTILGVMGVDVTTAQLESHTPFSKIGPNGYAFAINPNGYVVFHPNLKTLGKFMKEPPNIDLLELEIESEYLGLDNLRTAMIKEENSEMIIQSLYLSPDRRYVSHGQATYAYIPIENTTFRLGISVPMYQKKYPKFNSDLNKFVWPYSEDYTILIAPWDYHKEMSKMKNLGGTLTDVIDLLKKDPRPDQYNLDLLNHLYWDIKVAAKKSVTGHIKNVMGDDNNNETDSQSEVKAKAVFIMGNGGMTLVHPKSEADYFRDMRDLRKSTLYTRALYSASCVLLPDHIVEKRSNTSEPPYINIACPISITTENSHKQSITIDKPAVTGIRVSHDQLMNKILSGIDLATEEIKKQKARESPSTFFDLMTCQDASLLCYFLDDGGFLIATNREDSREQVGRFFGQVDPPLMKTMIGQLYQKTIQYDFQAACKIEEDKMSAGFKSFNIPSINLVSELLSTGFWTSKISWAFTSFNFFSWLFSPSIEVMAEDTESNEKECVKSIQQYYLMHPFKKTYYPHQLGFQCDNCTRNFTAVRLKYMDLLFIVADPMCEECDDMYPNIEQAPREISETEEQEIICQLAQNPRKRVQAYGCYASDPKEDQTECGCAGLRASWMSLLLALSLLMWRQIYSVS